MTTDKAVTDESIVARDEIMKRREIGAALWLASFSKATPESALRSSGLSEEQIRQVKGI